MSRARAHHGGMDAETDAERGTVRHWWATADTASAAAGQLVVWIALLTVSIFATMVEPGVEWWLAIAAWTVGLIASTVTLMHRTGMVSRVRRRPPLTQAGTFSWGLGTAVLAAVAVTALAVLISTGSAVFLVVVLLAAAAAVWSGACGLLRAGSPH